MRTKEWNKFPRSIRHIAGTATLFVISLLTITLLSCNGGNAAKKVEKKAEKKVVLKLADSSTLYFKGAGLDTNFRPARIDSIVLRQHNKEHAISNNKLIVPSGLTYPLQLPDGSLAYINSGTQLLFPFIFSGKGRQITLLEGEVYFRVTATPGNEFVVHTPQGDVLARGTSFNVSYLNGKLSVSVVSGLVVIFKPPLLKQSELLPGQQANYSKGQDGVTITSFEPSSVVGWLDGYYRFDRATLAEVSKRLEQVFDIVVVIDDPVLKGKRMSGVILKKDRPQTITTICHTGGFEHYFDDQGQLHFRYVRIKHSSNPKTFKNG